MLRIFSFLNLELKESLRLCTTCKSWWQLRRQIPIHDLDLTGPPCSSPYNIQQHVMESLTVHQLLTVRRLICDSYVLRLGHDALAQLQSCPNLQFLILSPERSSSGDKVKSGIISDWSSLRVLLRNLPHLICLDVSHCDMTDIHLEMIAECCHNLQGLDVSFNPRVSDRGLSHLLAQNVNMQELDISFCNSLTSASITAVATHCQQLQVLYAEWEIHLCRQPYLVSLTSLSHLLSQCLDLKVLSLKNNVHCEAAPPVPDQANAGHLPAVDSLRCSSTALYHLDLTGCRWMDTSSWLTLVEGLSALQVLRVTGARTFTDQVACSIGRQCPQLMEIILDDCQVLTDEGMEAILMGCGQLSILVLEGCPGLTCRLLEYLPSCADLSHWIMRGCNHSSLTVDAVQDCLGHMNVSEGLVEVGGGFLRVEEGRTSLSTSSWGGLLQFLQLKADAMAIVPD